MWMENCEVDVDYHLRRARVPSPGGRRELDQLIGEIASTPLDRTRPLWEFHFAEGMAQNRFALIGKVHHTLADGVASANLLARLMDLAGSEQDAGTDDPPCARPSKPQLLWEAQLDHFKQMACSAGTDQRCRTRCRARAAALQGAAGPSGNGQGVQCTTDLPQSRCVAAPDVRDRYAFTRRGQRDGQGTSA